MNFHVLTLFPEMVLNGVNTSITGRAVESGKISVNAINIRDFSTDKHKKVDDYPYGGGAGMLMQAQPVYDAYKSVESKIPADSKKRVVYVTPQGYQFTQRMAEDLSKNDDLILICGHYEGIDERVLEEIVDDYVSIGDYVLTGGELASMVMIDAISRLVPGVLHNEMSAETESFHGYLLEYPQYTRPEEWHGKAVPEILLSGNQKKINDWRTEQSKKRTLERRQDLYDQYFELQIWKERLMLQKLLHIDMIELINRGRAILIAKNNHDVLIQDKLSGLYYHSGDNPVFFMTLPDKIRLSIDSIILHQKEMVEPVKKILCLKDTRVCYQSVYTLKERMAIGGLYRTDGQPTEDGFTIRLLTMEHFDIVQQNYDNTVDYIEERLKRGCVYGGFLGETLVGFIGIHADGSMGMLKVLPQYQGRNIGKALETYLVNKIVEWGWIPFGQVRKDNEITMQMQRSLGFYRSKTPVYWLEKEK